MKSIFDKIITASFLAGSIIFVQAQKSDAKSKQILDAVASNYKAKKNSYFKFSYGTGENGKTTKTETGIFYTTPTQYKLKIMGVEQIFDGKKVYNISEEDQEVTIAKAENNEVMFSPTSYLQSYKKDYNASYQGKKTVNGVNADLIMLTPVKDNGLKAVYLYINQPKKQIVKIEQHSNDKSVAVIAVSDYKENQNLSSTMFSFDKSKYKNYIITEL
ncbi:MAG: outer membrane lipoprotein carrier protein LolA [Bergeyella sp.]